MISCKSASAPQASAKQTRRQTQDEQLPLRRRAPRPPPPVDIARAIRILEPNSSAHQHSARFLPVADLIRKARGGAKILDKEDMHREVASDRFTDLNNQRNPTPPRPSCEPRPK